DTLGKIMILKSILNLLEDMEGSYALLCNSKVGPYSAALWAPRAESIAELCSQAMMRYGQLSSEKEKWLAMILERMTLNLRMDKEGKPKKPRFGKCVHPQVGGETRSAALTPTFPWDPRRPRGTTSNVVHAIQATKQSIEVTDLVTRLCPMLVNRNRVIYYICDTVLRVKRVGLTSGVNREKWQMWAARHYYFLLLSLARDL
ncbi:hypothetical protein U0070_000119, partial [Myodes glareolus]